MASHHKSRAKGVTSTILIAAPLCILLISSKNPFPAASPAPALTAPEQAGRIKVDVREDGRIARSKMLRPLRASDIVLTLSLSPHVEERVSPRSSTADGGEPARAVEPGPEDPRPSETVSRSEWR